MWVHVHTSCALLFIQVRWCCGDCRGLSIQPGCNIVWFYRHCSLMWNWLNGGWHSWRSGLWGNLAWDYNAAKVPADGPQGAEFCSWDARWQPAQFIAEIKRLSSLCLFKLGRLGVCCCFEEAPKIIWDEKWSKIERMSHRYSVLLSAQKAPISRNWMLKSAKQRSCEKKLLLSINAKHWVLSQAN